MTSQRSRPLPTLISSRYGIIVIGIILTVLVAALVQIAPDREGMTGDDEQTNDLIAPDLSSTQALAAWHYDPLESQTSEDTDSHEHLTQAWIAFCGKFSPLPRFDELPATFRVRTLAVGHGEDKGFTLAMSSEWDAETIADKLRPFRDRLSKFAAHRVDIDRLDNGVLVETHEFKPSGKIYILRHGSWVIATDIETNIPALAKAAIEQTPGEKQDITPATYKQLSNVLKSYDIDTKADHDE